MDPPAVERQWISFEDPDEERTWLFDATFLESSWNCIYGNGCQGIDEHPDPDAHHGCCSHGAYFSDAADLSRVEQAVARLTPEVWQLARVADELGGPIHRDDDATEGAAEWRTRLVDGACIFQNRPDHPGGPGCALHQLALATETSPVELKPEVCWQVPVRREDHETETGHLFTMVREWERKDWGDGGTEFAWWCTEAPEAHTGGQPAYVTLAEELTNICGPTIYEALRGSLDERRSAGRASTHPALLQIGIKPA